MLSRVYSAALFGIEGILVTVEVDILPGLPSLATVGLPDASVREARDRVVSAIRNSGFDFPIKKITVNLAPAGLRKEGASFDLPIAIGILSASEAIRQKHLENWCLVGELALDGTLQPVKGILPIAIALKERNMQGLILPPANANEASVVQGLRIFAAHSLKEAAQFLDQETIAVQPQDSRPKFAPEPGSALDFADVKGQSFAKRALEIACAGAHNVLMVGPPGSGKTMLSKCLTSILPALTFEESMETSRIHSVASHLPPAAGLIRSRPFRQPHHTISHIALIGGGSNPRPGEVSLAHNGVLFLDELPEFNRNALEVLRQPLESGEIVIARAKESVVFPSRFMLVAAMNPCPCGFYGHPSRPCICAPVQVQKYMSKISGPLMDRIDIHLEVPALKTDELLDEEAAGESSSEIRKRIVKARQIQQERFKPVNLPKNGDRRIYVNAHMRQREVKRFCGLQAEGKALLSKAIEKLGLSARAYNRILKVARTIADLDGTESIRTSHLAEAIQYRSLDRSRN